MGPQITRRPGELVFSLLMLLVSVVLFWNAYKIAGFSAKSSPGAFPLVATAVMVIAALANVSRALKASGGGLGWGAFRASVVPNLVLVFSVLILLYGLFLERLGFILTSVVFLFASMVLLHRRGVGPALGYSLLSLLVVYVIFRLVFQVVLPEGIIPERRILADIGAWIAGVLGR